MYTPFRRLLAGFLLFSFLLQSCSPNLGYTPPEQEVAKISLELLDNRDESLSLPIDPSARTTLSIASSLPEPSHTLLNQRGDTVKFYEIYGRWKAQVQSSLQGYDEPLLPVICEGHQSPKVLLSKFSKQESIIHKHSVYEVHAPRGKAIFLGSLGLLGGMNQEEKKESTSILEKLKDKTRECDKTYKTGNYEQTISICNALIKEFGDIKLDLDKEYSALLSIILGIKAKCHQSLNQLDKFFEAYEQILKINDKHIEIKKFFENAEKRLTENYIDGLKLVDKKYEETKKISNKTNITDIENVKLDPARLDFITTCLGFLEKELKTELDLVSNHPELTIFDKFYLKWRLLTQAIEFLKYIGHCIVNLSGELRGGYKELLNTYGISWITLEHIARIVDDGQGKVSVVPFLPEDASEKIIFNHFYSEYQSLILIAEEAMEDILRDDVSKLKTIFEYINHGDKKAPYPKVGNLLAIKTLSKLVLDLCTLANLLRVAMNKDFIDDYNSTKQYNEFKKASILNNDEPLSIIGCNKINELLQNIDNKLYQHAFLRKLQKIGELVTNKNLSNSTKNLNPTIDWQIFIDIRNAITHQDEGISKYKVSELLNKELKMLSEALQEISYGFFLKLCNLVKVRHEGLPVKFDKNFTNVKSFWQAIYQQELKADKTGQVSKRRVSEEDYDGLIQELAKLRIEDELLRKWNDFLLGKIDRPNKGEWGLMLQPLKELDGNLKKKLKKAYNSSADLSKHERVRIEEKLAKEREEKKALQKNSIDYKGLEKLKKLRDFLIEKKADDANEEIGNSGRLDSAIKALRNIKEYLEQDEFIKIDFNYSNSEAWSKDNESNQDCIGNFLTRMLTSPILRDAIEYNAGQLLQNLDTLRDKSEEFKKLLSNEYYEPLRLLRNHIEHGNHIYDAQRYQPEKEPEILDEKSKIIGFMMIQLIFDLLPSLENMSLIEQRIK
jgi:uncharacterized protein with HEPN domain